MITSILVALAATTLVAQHAHHAAGAAGVPSSLTPESVQQLLNGEGMGLAKAGELHGYPGPKHVLELKKELALSTEVESRVEEIRQRMLDRARALGRQIVDAELALDAAFSDGTITDATLSERTAAIARLQAELRAAHLRAHLQTKPLLSPRQIEKYGKLRGH